MLVTFVACAETAIKDSLTNNVTLINISQNYVTKKLPLWLQSLACYAQVRRNSDEPQHATVRFVVQSGAVVLATKSMAIDFGKDLGWDVFTRFQVIVPVAGEVFVRVDVNGSKPGVFSFLVTQGDPSEIGKTIEPGFPPPSQIPARTV